MKTIYCDYKMALNYTFIYIYIYIFGIYAEGAEVRVLCQYEIHVKEEYYFFKSTVKLL